MMADLEEHTVYLIAHRADGGKYVGPVKVGYSRYPERRLATLQTGNPSRLSIVASMRAPSRELAREAESLFHRVADDRRMGGEWFDLAPVEALATLVKCFTALIGTQIAESEAAVEMLRWAGAREAVAAFVKLTERGDD